MAKIVGTALSREIETKIAKERAKHETDEVIILGTVEESGFPHYSLLNFLDIAVVSSKRILFTIGEKSHTYRNLVGQKKATIAFWTGPKKGSMIYISGIAREIAGNSPDVEGFKTAMFALDIHSVLEDVSHLTKLVSTLTYQARRVNFDHTRLSQMLEDQSRLMRKKSKKSRSIAG